MSEETIERTFKVEGTPTVRVENINGSVTVIPGPSGEVAVQAIKHGSSTFPVEIKQEEDGSIVVSAKPNKSKMQFLSMSLDKAKVAFNLSVPAETNLLVKAVNSKTDVSGIRGELSLGAVNGAITVNDVSGKLKFDTVNGEISGSHISGDAVLKTVNGKIHLVGSDFPSLTAGTVNGSIQLDTPMGEGPYNLKTVSGNVKIKTDNAPKGRVHFKSVSGSVRVNKKRVATNGNSPGMPVRKVFEFGEDGPEIHFKSVSGNLDFLTDAEDIVKVVAVKKAQAVEEAPATQEVTVSAPELDLMSILEKISSGELSVDDGVSELQSS